MRPSNKLRRAMTRPQPTSAPDDGFAAARSDRPFDPAHILTATGDVPYDWDIGSDRLRWGANAQHVLQVDDLAAISTGRLYGYRLDPDNAETRFDAIMASGERDEGAGVLYRVEYRLRSGSAAQRPLWVEDVGRWYAGPDGRPAWAHGVVRDITERHMQQERLAYLSRFDGLTGEMNRWHLTELLGEAIAAAERQDGCCAFLIVAIDNVTHINDAYGFEVADEVISAVGKRLRAKLRGRDCLGRFSGNKFGVILKDCSPEDMEVAAQRLLAAVRSDVVQTGAGPVAATVTIGGVAAPRHARTIRDVIARAQESMFAARAKRQGSFLAYRPSVEREALRQENIRATDEILAALNERRIVLAFEPIVDNRARRLAFFECLMRGRRRDGTVLAAGSIIPAAERLGLIRLIDHRIVELVVGELAADPGLRVSFNVSPASTIDPDWWANLDAHLRRHPGVAERLIVEITEMAAIHNVDDTRGFVLRVKDLGCRIAIDDFGAGHTSFRNLRRLGVDMVKIDGAFVQNLSRARDDRVFVRSLIDLARGLGIATVAEWVQDEAAAALLTEWGCDYLQGALIGRASMAQADGVETDAPAIAAPRSR